MLTMTRHMRPVRYWKRHKPREEDKRLVVKIPKNQPSVTRKRNTKKR